VFLDESVNMKAIPPVRAMFPEHEYFASGVDAPPGLDDTDLYPLVADLGCQIYICGDIRQLDTRVHEVIACGKAGLHWVGVQKVPARGRGTATADASRMIGGLLHVFNDVAAEPDDPKYYHLGAGPIDLAAACEQRGLISEIT
jgi:hypothetical protein